MSKGNTQSLAAGWTVGRDTRWFQRDAIRLLKNVQSKAELLPVAVSWEHVNVHAKEISELSRCAADFVGCLESSNQDDHPTVDLAHTLRTSRTLLRALASPEIELDFQITQLPAIATLSPVAFEQILINLVDNAKNAGAKRLTFELQVEPYLEGETVADGGFATLTALDNGPGISEQMLDQVTEKFFADNDPQWFGEGLKLINFTARNAGGYLAVWNDSEYGLAVNVRIPVERHEAPAA
ncbi:MAG: HAMP domain-containing sensor histidine kinase [Pseudomonadota bacterium]